MKNEFFEVMIKNRRFDFTEHYFFKTEENAERFAKENEDEDFEIFICDRTFED